MLVALTAHRAHWRGERGGGWWGCAHIIKQRGACAQVPVISGDVPVLRVSPPSLLYLSIIKLARFWGGRRGGGGRLCSSDAHSNRFKPMGPCPAPRNQAHSPQSAPGAACLPACLPPSSPSSEFRRDQTQTQEKKEGESERRDTWGKASSFFLLRTMVRI